MARAWGRRLALRRHFSPVASEPQPLPAVLPVPIRVLLFWKHAMPELIIVEHRRHVNSGMLRWDAEASRRYAKAPEDRRSLRRFARLQGVGWVRARRRVATRPQFTEPAISADPGMEVPRAGRIRLPGTALERASNELAGLAYAVQGGAGGLMPRQYQASTKPGGKLWPCGWPERSVEGWEQAWQMRVGD